MQYTELSTRPQDLRAAEIFLGYCNRTQRFRMMGMDEFLGNVSEGVQRMWGDREARAGRPPSPWGGGPREDRQRLRYGDEHAHHQRHQDCGCGCGGHCHDHHDCHCDCCVCDADVLVHARCGERRRISLTFENDTRREREVKLTLGAFSTAGGTELGWAAKLSATDFVLRGCEERTVLLDVTVDCAKLIPQDGSEDSTKRGEPRTVDRCVVGYATVRAEGCLTRPVVVAVAVLPDDCHSHTAHCGCNCC